MLRQQMIRNTATIQASAESVWQHITQVDVTAMKHSVLLSLIGIPKPMRSEITQTGVGGRRIAYFSNGKRFTQEITAWNPYQQYAFSFQAEPRFRVAYLLDLANGPFQIQSATYTLSPTADGIKLLLESTYQLRGIIGIFLSLPIRLILRSINQRLLDNIRMNAEKPTPSPAHHLSRGIDSVVNDWKIPEGSDTPPPPRDC